MSLVAYDASSDEDTDYEDDAPKAVVVEKVIPLPPTELHVKVSTNGHISDEDDDFMVNANETDHTSVTSLAQLLPKPKNNTNLVDVLESFAKPTFEVLPTPKAVNVPQEIEEEDDEFLHKKPSDEIIEKPQKITETKKMPIIITIPSLKNFHDVDKEMAEKAKNKNVPDQTKLKKSSGLLGLLPKAKSEQNFAKTNNNLKSEDSNEASGSINSIKPVKLAFVPDSVKHRRPAANTEDVDRTKSNKKKTPSQVATKTQINKTADSDESGDEESGSGDFFSFNIDQSLPEVSANEINALVAKKAAKIAEITTKYLNKNETVSGEDQIQIDEQQLENSRKRLHHDEPLNHEAFQALVGGSSKRRRQQQDDIQIIDINSEQVLPNKEEWMRTALASSTTYQPTGVLVDEEPASGTRRKHQITYLAHKAKANEAELQAMWSANRQNRRATQSKYGF